MGMNQESMKAHLQREIERTIPAPKIGNQFTEDVFFKKSLQNATQRSAKSLK